MTVTAPKFPPAVVYLLTFLLLAVIFLVTQLFQGLYFHTEIFPKAPLKEMSSFHILLGTATQALLAVIFSLLFLKRTRLSIFDFQNQFHIWHLLAGLVGLLVVYIIINLFMSLFNVSIDQFENLPRANIKNSPFNFILAVVIIAPLYEEFLYRGVILGAIINSYEDPTPLQTALALSYSSLLFAIMHFNLDSFLPIFALGLYLGALSLHKKNIFLPMTIHLVNNLYISIQFIWGN